MKKTHIWNIAFGLLSLGLALTGCWSNGESSRTEQRVSETPVANVPVETIEVPRPEVVAAPPTKEKALSVEQSLYLPHVERLENMVLKGDSTGITALIDFPLDARSAYAFGLGADTVQDSLSKEDFTAQFSSFFAPPMIDKLKRESPGYALYGVGESSGKIHFTFAVHTLSPWEDDPEIQMECTRSIYCSIEQGQLMITGFNSLCGGVA